MASARERNHALFSGPLGSLYSSYIERERVSRIVGRAFWGSDVRPYYASMRVIGTAPAGATVVDCPCGSGVALRGLRAEQRVRYLGFDIAPPMLERARRRARERGLSQPVFAEGEATRLPLGDGTADLFLSYFGLHCLDDPQGALHEAARCLRSGGRLVGAAIVRGGRPLDRLRVRPGVGGFGRVGGEDDLRLWLEAASFGGIEVETSGIFAVFRAAKR